MIFSFSRIVTAEKSPNDSAQSPACSRKPRPAATSASAACRLRASPAKTSGGIPKSCSRTSRAWSASGHSGCCSAGIERHDAGDQVSGGAAILGRILPMRMGAKSRPALATVAAHMTRIFSGIQPTGQKHLGNYIGAIRHYVTDQDLGEAFYCVVDLHSISVAYDRDTLAENTLDTAATLLAAGLEPDRCTLFVQSHVPAHSEGAWLLGAVAAYGELTYMTQFKDKGEGRESVSVDLFIYPVLMAADILLYDTDRVPVGDDQRQHLELARDVAIRFNHHYGDVFVVPEAAIPPVGARVMDLQEPTRKMSKSVDSPQGTVGVLDSPDVISRKVKRAVTDTGSDVRYDPDHQPGVANLLQLLSATT